MKRRINKSLKIVVSLLFFLWLFPHWMYSCAPEFPYAVFTYKYHPDFPLKNYAAGAIGIPQPTYARSYLVVAYRYLSGVSLNPGEQAAAVELWKYRNGTELDSSNAIREWLEARKLISGASSKDEVKDFRYQSNYNGYIACSDDAFHTAAVTLKKRTKQYGTSSPEIHDWLIAQDIVFASCGATSVSNQSDSSNDRTRRPVLESIKEAAPTAPLWFRTDRNYQIAARNFYEENFDLARQQFEKIAADPASPWSTLAPYLVARTMIRKAILGEKVDDAGLVQAEAQLNKILKTPELKAIHVKAQLLKGFVECQLYPTGRAHELARKLLRPRSAASMRQELDDYTRLLDGSLGDNAWVTEEDRKKLWRKGGEVEQLRNDELTDWIITFQSGKIGDHKHALARWRTKQTLPWLMAALTHATGTDPDLDDLLQAAAAVSQDSPAYLAAQYHRQRLLLDLGKVARARKENEDILADKNVRIPPSANNQLMALHMRVASDSPQLLHDALRKPLGAATDLESRRELPGDFGGPGAAAFDDQTTFHLPAIVFDADFGNLWTRELPLSISASFLRDTNVPDILRRDLALATFTRAVILKNGPAGAQAARVLNQLEPELGPSLQEYLSAQDAESSHFAGIFVLLHAPGMRPYLATGLGRLTKPSRIDDYRDNWWCQLSDTLDFSEPVYHIIQTHWYPDYYKFMDLLPLKPPKLWYPPFLSEEEKSQAAAEWKTVQAASPSANYLGREVLSWAQTHPDDPRVPEALHLVIRAARYGCNDKQTTHFAGDCFRYLHQHYPDSQWSRKTEIWYQD